MCRLYWGWILVLFFGCKEAEEKPVMLDSASISFHNDSVPYAKDTSSLAVNEVLISTGDVHPEELVTFAKTLIGVPYRYGSIDPKQGFDCSGFITYVFSHFKIKVPRSSIDFTNVGRTVPLDSAKSADLILFTGTDSTEKFIGHMGIIVSNQNGIVEFIHSTSGKQYSVTITPLNRYYMGRYVRTARIFKQNNSNYQAKQKFKVAP
jgi:cell wall-associated NlpC family hydrolase